MEDQKFLERLMAQEEEDRAIQTARRERTKADAAWMKQVGGAGVWRWVGEGVTMGRARFDEGMFLVGMNTWSAVVLGK